jgi:hypothetical protein
MTRRDLATALQNVSKALTESNIIDTLAMLFTREGVDTAIALGAFQKYSKLSNLYGDNEHKIVKIFKLEELEKTSFWQEFIAGDPDAYGPVGEVRNQATLIVSYIPNLLKLLEQDGISFLKGGQNKPEYFQGKQFLTTILPEDDKLFSSPHRLVNVIESIELLYAVCARLEGMSENDLAVVAIDSGSDKSFDFIGAAKIVECVKDTIIALWDRIVFYRERKQSERLDLIEKGLPLIERINRLEVEEALSSEQAELFRRDVFQGIHKFVKSGAIIPELNVVSTHSPRKLMAAEPKLLVEKSSNGPQTTENVGHEDNPEQSLDANEMEQLKKLLNKLNGKNQDT